MANSFLTTIDFSNFDNLFSVMEYFHDENICKLALALRLLFFLNDILICLGLSLRLIFILVLILVLILFHNKHPFSRTAVYVFAVSLFPASIIILHRYCENPVTDFLTFVTF